MAIPIRLILLICVVEVVRGQFPELDIGTLPHKPTGSPRLTGRFVPRQGPKSATTQTISSKIRRPIPLKARPTADPLESSSSFPPRHARPVFIPTQKESAPPPPPPPPQPPQQDQPIKPVSEEHDDEPEDSSQAITNIANIGANIQPSAPHIPSFFSAQSTPRPEQQIFHFRPNIPRPPPPPPQEPAPVQYRPQKPVKPRKPIEEIQEVRIPIKQNQLPQVKKPAKTDYRGKKPVAQIIRRWREDNPDGSITWGFENDDGSYKEEVIGVDCITRGKYGYVDPDGIRREYTYETGIRCDEEEQQEEENGFVDYQENKLVLPNGKTIDLSSMGKKQARRPVYRN